MKPSDWGCPAFAPKGYGEPPGSGPRVDARKGFAAPASPVACGRRPTPRPVPKALNPPFAPPKPPKALKPVGCQFRAPAPVGLNTAPVLLNVPELLDDGPFGVADVGGVVGSGIEGRDSNSAVPNDDVG